MRRRLFAVVLIVAAMLTLFGAVHAEETPKATDPLKVSMTLSANRFTEPKAITISISISNTGETPMLSPVKLFYPDGTQVTEFGEPELDVGGIASWEGTWTVTQEELEAGKIRFMAEYVLLNEEGQKYIKQKFFSKPIAYESGQPATVITRTIQPLIAKKDQTVTITYEIANTGTVDITDVRITENKSVSKGTGKIALIKAGESASYTFEVKMGTKDLTSSGAIRYKAGDKEYTETKEAETIRFGEVKLTAKLSADKKGGVIGDKAVLTLTITNSGKLAYEGISVTDTILEEVFTDVSVPAGETVTLTTDVEIDTTKSYQFVITAKDEAGMQVETATERVTVTAINPNEVVDLEVVAEADRSSVYELPGAVVFTVSATNNSEAEMKDVAIRTSGYTIYTFPTLQAHETRTFTRELYVSMAGTYQFTGVVKDQLGTNKTFESNKISIRKAAAPTAVPTAVPQRAPVKPTRIATHTPLPAGYVPGQSGDGSAEAAVASAGDNGSLMRSLGLGLLVPVAIGGVLTLIGLINRIRQGAASRSALDHLDVRNTRDYEKILGDGEEKEEAPALPAGEEARDGTDRSRDAGDPFKPEIDDAFEQAVEAAVRRRSRTGSGDQQPPQEN